MKYIQIFAVNEKFKLYVKYIRKCDNKWDDLKDKGGLSLINNDFLFDVKDIFPGINNTVYFGKNQVSRQPYKEMILYLTKDFYYFTKYGKELLYKALEEDNDLVIEIVYYILFSDNTLEDKLEEIEKRIKQVEESTDKLEEIEKKIKQIEESTDKHFQLLMEKLNKIKLL
ncbi:14227_t:CDS:2 [Entrophospora sp. SA101]|nr:14227_t:CDS:2 [Entrophospora sp. SA101]